MDYARICSKNMSFSMNFLMAFLSVKDPYAMLSFASADSVDMSDICITLSVNFSDEAYLADDVDDAVTYRSISSDSHLRAKFRNENRALSFDGCTHAVPEWYSPCSMALGLIAKLSKL